MSLTTWPLCKATILSLTSTVCCKSWLETKTVTFYPEESQKGKEAIIRFLKKFLLIFFVLSIASITLRSSMLHISSYSCLFSLSILFSSLDIAIFPKYCSKLIASIIMKYLRSNDVRSFDFFF